jgi:hypothetical protein
MSSGRTLRRKIVAKLTELQHLYEAGQITPDSNQYLDLMALQELQWNMVQLEHLASYTDGENAEEMIFQEMASMGQTLH